MAEPDDWRLTGQERYLYGRELRLSPWFSDRPDWDHDHCAFCAAKIGTAPKVPTSFGLVTSLLTTVRHPLPPDSGR